MQATWDKVSVLYPDKNKSFQAEEVYASTVERVDVTHSMTSNNDTNMLEALKADILLRVEMLKAGELKQQTFPSNEIHEGYNEKEGFQKRLDNWRSNQTNNEVITEKPTPTPAM